MNTHQHKSATVFSLRMRVDRTLCQGHARCVVLAPELFEADEFGGGREIGDGGVPSVRGPRQLPVTFGPK